MSYNCTGTGSDCGASCAQNAATQTYDPTALVNGQTNAALKNNANCSGVTFAAKANILDMVQAGSSGTMSTGCGQLAFTNVVGQTILNACSCTINSLKNSTTTTVTVNENVNVNFEGSVITGTSINITAGANITTQNIASMSSSMSSALTASAKAVLQQASNALNTLTNGGGAGSINSSGSIANSFQTFASSNDNTVQNIINNCSSVVIVANQQVTVNMKYCTITNASVNITLDDIINNMNQNIANNIVSAVLSQNLDLQSLQSATSSNTATNTGADFLGTGLPVWAIIVAGVLVAAIVFLALRPCGRGGGGGGGGFHTPYSAPSQYNRTPYAPLPSYTASPQYGNPYASPSSASMHR